MPPLCSAQASKRAVAFAFLLAVTISPIALAQTETASVSGRATDQSGAVVPDVQIEIRNVDTNVTQATSTKDDGFYVFTSLKPGNYIMSAHKAPFRTFSVNGIVLNVQQNRTQDFVLEVGTAAESVTVTAESSGVNTESGAVSTVINRQFVENLPMNGRTFQTLMELTPGVVITTGSNFNGTISVNGQRQDANSFMVDGVSANVGFTASAGSAFTIGGAQPGGNLPNLTTLGTTQSMVSVDAMQEFRIQTSTYSAEYGRQPGGQVSIVTRSGTNSFHGTLSDYFRNTIFDANNWFANQTGRARPAEQQNDFGGTLGGPLDIPRVYNGKDRTFFFFSYEGLRLRQPTFAITNVPTVALRDSAPPSLQPVLKAFPLPNCPAGSAPAVCSNDLGNGLGVFSSSYSNPASLDAASLRVDHMITARWTLFGRYNHAPSQTLSRISSNLALVSGSDETTQTATLGLTGLVSPRLTNDLRFNYSHAPAYGTVISDSFGGSIPAGPSVLLPSQFNAASTQAVVSMVFPGGTVSSVPWDVVSGHLTENEDQFNIVDALSYSVGAHLLKFGVDWRRLTPFQSENQYLVQANFTSQQQVLNGVAPTGSLRAQGVAKPLYKNFSAFVQDHWRTSRRLTLDLGVRWDVNPAPGSVDGVIPPAVNQAGNFAAMALAPPGTPDWKTTYKNFGPRLGAAYQLVQQPGHELVLRGGFGVFYDTGNNLGSAGFNSYPFNITQSITNVVFPISAAQVPPPALPNLAHLTAPYGTMFLFDPNLQLPYTLQWSVALEEALGASQAVTVSYVGNSGRRMLQNQQYSIGTVNPSFTTIDLTANESSSSYHSLQTQYRRQLSHGLQALLSYTWSHAIDTASTDAASVFPPIRGNAAWDVPQIVAAGLTYEIAAPISNRLAAAVLKNWSVSTNIHAQSGLPVNAVASQTLNPATGSYTIAFPSVVAGQPDYLYGAQCAQSNGGQGCPGGRRVNPAAFKAPAAGQNGNLGRDVLRGTGSWQADLAMQRTFRVTEGLRLEARCEAFNVLNHPNFGLPNVTLGAANFGEPTTMLSGALPGVSSLYQIGGPRSLQFAMKLKF